MASNPYQKFRQQLFLLWLCHILGTLTVILFNIKKIPATPPTIFTSAFSPTAAVTVLQVPAFRMAIQNGVAQRVFLTIQSWFCSHCSGCTAEQNGLLSKGLISMTRPLLIRWLSVLCGCDNRNWGLGGDLNGLPWLSQPSPAVFSHFGPALLTVFLVLFADDSRMELLRRAAVLSFSLVFVLSGSIDVVFVVCGLVRRIYRVGYGLDYRRYRQCLNG